MEYKGTKLHRNADGLSRLPQVESEKANDPAVVFHMSQMEPLPVTSTQVQKKTRNDPVLAKVYDLTVKGWPAPGDGQLPVYSTLQDQLSVCQGCIMWGCVVPPKLRLRVLTSLHEEHLGVVKIKSIARGYVWWPGMDSQIEDLAKSCTGCQQTQC